MQRLKSKLTFPTPALSGSGSPEKNLLQVFGYDLSLPYTGQHPFVMANV